MKVLICDPVEDEVLKLFRTKFEVKVGGDPNNTDAHVIIVRSRTEVTKEVIESAKNLKIIGRPGAGLDNIDVKEAEKRDIKVMNTPEALTESVAELTVGLILSLARDIPKADKNLKEGKWLKSELKGIELSRRTLGILGLGKIGCRVMEICTAMGMKVIYWSRQRKMDLEKKIGAEYLDLPVLFMQSDFLSLHVALTPQTKGIVGKKEITLMKPSAYLINTSRGAIVDENALYEALKNKQLAGAGLDVFIDEPYSGQLRELDNVIMTPHIGSNTREAQLKAGITLAEKIILELA